MTDQPSGRRNRRATLERFSRTRDTAVHFLNGPRSVMFADDPDGMRLWLEPIVRLTTWSRMPHEFRTLALFCVPNCLERDSTSPILVRDAYWNAGVDKELCKIQDVSKPSIAVLFQAIESEEVATIDTLLRKLDASLPGFSFPVEGLDLDGPSGFRPLPENAVIVTGGVHKALKRVTRFQGYDLGWWSNDKKLSPVDIYWDSLFGALRGIMASPDRTQVANIVEKYDPLPDV